MKDTTMQTLQQSLDRYKKLMRAEIDGQHAHKQNKTVEDCPKDISDEERILWISGWDRMETIKIAGRVDELETIVQWSIDALETVEKRLNDPEHQEELVEDVLPKISSVVGKLKEYVDKI